MQKRKCDGINTTRCIEFLYFIFVKRTKVTFLGIGKKRFQQTHQADIVLLFVFNGWLTSARNPRKTVYFAIEVDLFHCNQWHIVNGQDVSRLQTDSFEHVGFEAQSNDLRLVLHVLSACEFVRIERARFNLGFLQLCSSKINNACQ